MAKKRTKKSVGGQQGYAEIWNFIKDSKKFIYVILGLFLISAAVGFFYPQLLQGMLQDLINSIVDQTKNLNFGQLLSYIIYNNAKTSALGMLLGLMFGIFPVFLSALNGYMIGFVFNKLYISNEISNSWRILPHGIFELPAFFLSLGLGLMLGYTLFFDSKQFKEKFLMSLKTFVYVIVPLLLIAGFIETSLIFLLR